MECGDLSWILCATRPWYMARSASPFQISYVEWTLSQGLRPGFVPKSRGECSRGGAATSKGQFKIYVRFSTCRRTPKHFRVRIYEIMYQARRHRQSKRVPDGFRRGSRNEHEGTISANSHHRHTHPLL